MRFRNLPAAFCTSTRARRGGPPDALVGDRKSTRLNSSHTVISYAVFCLKKKKKGADKQCRGARKSESVTGSTHSVRPRGDVRASSVRASVRIATDSYRVVHREVGESLRL